MVSKKNITGLSGCPRLSALTLYDTPLSLKVSYRHCVINSIWTLKALDNHVISDEEIMEDWHLPSKFRAKAPQFCVNLYPQLKLTVWMCVAMEIVGEEVNLSQYTSIPSFSGNRQKILDPGAQRWSAPPDLDAKAMDSESFCLFGLKATMHLSKPFADMLMSRKADGQDVRDAIGHLHKLKAHAPSLRQPRPPNITAEKRLVDQRSNCLSLAPFWEIERAYRAREKAEDLRARVERVVQAQALRADACSRHDAFGMSRRKEALEQRERERVEAAEAMSLRRAQREQEVQRVRQRHARFLEEKRRKASERETVELFSRQHVSLATAVARHCTRQNLRHALHERRQRVASIKQHTTAGGPDTPGQQQ
ncbi:hypothetical protein P4O66_004669 [Electrophorus voltai]|uniref:Uncharacterized protein n=1 Tax=Electrophorus voltai TaxID=2609070 RepID=A0AAD8ZMZ0_9TELE|nr:hypothetical protein P4O66_004669 [Electrophorus voltai]